MKKLIFTLLSAVGMCSSCTASDGNVLTPKEFQAAIDSDTTAYVLDVRRPEEYNDGHIKNAHLLNVLDEKDFEAGMKQLDYTRTYYIYCRSGRRSHAAWQKLTNEGFKAFDLEGGILNWQKQQMPVVSEKKEN